MVNRLAEQTIERLVEKEILQKNLREEYVYVLVNIIERTFVYMALFIFAFWMRNFLPTLVFMLFFFNLRKRTGGFHAPSYIMCFGGTLILYYFLVIYIYPYFLEHPEILFYGVVLSSIIIGLIGTVNHPNMDLDRKELEGTKRTARYVLAIELICIYVSYKLNIDITYIIYGAIGIITCAVLLCVSKLIRQEVKNYDEKESQRKYIKSNRKSGRGGN